MKTSSATALPYPSQEMPHEPPSDELRTLKKILRTQAVFHIVFFSIGALELALFIAFFALLSQSTILAFSLALFFLTVFSYFVLRLYLQAKKPDLLIELCETYLGRFRTQIGYQEGVLEHHMALADVAQRCATSLEGMEYAIYTPPRFLQSLLPTLEKFSCFSHWRDLHQLRELLFLTSIEEHLKVVKCEPTNLEVHAALANAYVLLSGLYSDPRGRGREDRWIPPERYTPQMERRFKEIARLAIEEFEILNSYAPNDPWVHMQLAYSYRDLQMPDQEITEYETILRLRPQDKEVLFKLGTLYFQHGRNAKGLEIYEILRKTHYSKAETLIHFYGYTPKK